MNRDTIERALAEPGPREAGYEFPALPLSHGAAESQPRGWSMLAAARMGMLAAAVVAGATLAIVLTRGPATVPGGRGTGAGSASPSAAESAPPAELAACTNADFAWSTDAWGAAAGSTGTSVLARGVSSLVGCRIEGSSLVVLHDANRQILLSVQAPSSSVVVHAGTLLEMSVSWSNWCSAEPAGPLYVTLTIPGDSRYVPLTPATGQVLVPPCNGALQPSVLNATDFQPSDRTPPEG